MIFIILRNKPTERSIRWLPTHHCWWSSSPRGYTSPVLVISLYRKIRTKHIVAGPYPTMKTRQAVVNKNTVVNYMAGIPRNTTKATFLQFSYPQPWYRQTDGFINLKRCTVRLQDILRDSSNQSFPISKCHYQIVRPAKCWSCKILSKVILRVKNINNLDCKSTTLFYELNRLCVGWFMLAERKENSSPEWLNKDSKVNNDDNQVLYQHFNLPNQKVRVLEKIQHPINNLTHIPPYTTGRELYQGVRDCNVVWL